MTLITIAAFIAALAGNTWLIARAAPSLARALAGPQRALAASDKPPATIIRLAGVRRPDRRHRPAAHHRPAPYRLAA